LTIDRKKAIDVAVVGAGAAGMALAIFTRKRRPDWRVVAIDGARTLGAKLLVTGGGRCNITNRQVAEADFCGGSRAIIRRVLRGHGIEPTLAFFRELGVEVVGEEGGKLFPRSGQARTVRDALLREMARQGVETVTGCRVLGMRRAAHGFHLLTPASDMAARRVALTTGGLALPRSGSDGAGYRLARALGHTIVTPTPALVPLTLDGSFHVALAGVSHDVELRLTAEGRKPHLVAGPLLFTHRGVSGPAVLDVSRHWLRAEVEGRQPRLLASFLPGHDFASAERRILELSAVHPRSTVVSTLARLVPTALARVLAGRVALGPTVRMAQLNRDDRRRLVHDLVECPLPVKGGGGYAEAEVTAGGVSLEEVEAGTLESRICPGLFFAGEILDVDGRLGGFNLQWAWSSAAAAGRGLAETTA
jgi:predicted Rossmann fold flavoprotein